MSNIRGYPQVVSKITVLSAGGLQKQDHFGGGEISTYHGGNLSLNQFLF